MHLRFAFVVALFGHGKIERSLFLIRMPYLKYFLQVLVEYILLAVRLCCVIFNVLIKPTGIKNNKNVNKQNSHDILVGISDWLRAG
jgi:hypothetical protein